MTTESRFLDTLVVNETDRRSCRLYRRDCYHKPYAEMFHCRQQLLVKSLLRDSMLQSPVPLTQLARQLDLKELQQYNTIIHIHSYRKISYFLANKRTDVSKLTRSFSFKKINSQKYLLVDVYYTFCISFLKFRSSNSSMIWTHLSYFCSNYVHIKYYSKSLLVLV